MQNSYNQKFEPFLTEPLHPMVDNVKLRSALSAILHATTSKVEVDDWECFLAPYIWPDQQPD